MLRCDGKVGDPTSPGSRAFRRHGDARLRSCRGALVTPTTSQVDLYWIPLGAGVGGGLVRWSGRAYEAVGALLARRPRCDLYHSALDVRHNGEASAIEMGPVWAKRGDRGVVSEGAVGAPLLGRSRLFRYEVRCWNGGSIPDVAEAVGGPVRVADDPGVARRVLELVAEYPTFTWGRDESSVGEMWNSNSLVAWLLTKAGIDLDSVVPPIGGRAPGWEAGRIVASRT